MVYKSGLKFNLENLFSESREKFSARNSSYLEGIKDIAGNRGYSHKLRISKIDNYLETNAYNLLNSEKDYIRNIMDTLYSHVSKTKKLRNKQVRNINEVSRDIVELRTNYLGKSGFKELSGKRHGESENINLLRPVELRDNVVQESKLETTISRNQDIGASNVINIRPGFFERFREYVGKAIRTGALVAITTGAVLFGSCGDDRNDLENKVNNIREERGVIEKEKKEEETSNSLLDNPDALAWKKIAEGYKKIIDLHNEAEERRLVEEESGRRKETLRLDEGRLVHKIASNLTLPQFPWGYAVVDEKKGQFKEIMEINYNHQNGSNNIDELKEIGELADLISVYETDRVNESSFKRLAKKAGLSLEEIKDFDSHGSGFIASTLIDHPDQSILKFLKVKGNKFDRLAQFSEDIRNSGEEFVSFRNKNGELCALGSLDAIKELRGND